MTSTPGIEIARRARMGGEERERLFRELWSGYWPRLASFLSALGLDEGDAEEAAQDALLKSFERILDYDPGHSFSTWLYAIGRNLARDRLRSGRRRGARSRGAGEAALGPDSDGSGRSRYPGPEELAMDAAEAEFARRFLGGLRPRDRAIAELFYGRDAACGEIALSVGAPVGTVKWRLSEIRRLLKAAWEAEYGR